MGVYTASSIVEKLLPFLLFPLLTRLLTPEEYRMISMFFVAVSVLGIFVGIGLDNYARVAYHKVKHDQFNNIISNVLTLLLVTVILVGLFVGVLVDSFSVWFGLSGTFVVFAVMLGVFNFVINLRLLTYQTQREPIKFAKIQIARS